MGTTGKTITKKGTTMASLKSQVSMYRDELNEGVSFIAFWKEGRSWNSEMIWVDVVSDSNWVVEEVSYEDVDNILASDPNAIIANGYHNMPFDAECHESVEYMAGHIRRHYENGWSQLADLKSW